MSVTAYLPLAKLSILTVFVTLFFECISFLIVRKRSGLFHGFPCCICVHTEFVGLTRGKIKHTKSSIDSGCLVCFCFVFPEFIKQYKTCAICVIENELANEHYRYIHTQPHTHTYQHSGKCTHARLVQALSAYPLDL